MTATTFSDDEPILFDDAIARDLSVMKRSLSNYRQAGVLPPPDGSFMGRNFTEANLATSVGEVAEVGGRRILQRVPEERGCVRLVFVGAVPHQLALR